MSTNCFASFYLSYSILTSDTIIVLTIQALPCGTLESWNYPGIILTHDLSLKFCITVCSVEFNAFIKITVKQISIGSV